MRLLPSASHPTPPHRARGGAAIEFALLLMLLVTILAGIVEFGRTFWYYDALSKATRNAARLMAVSSKATLSSVAVANARQLVASAATAAGVTGFTTSNVTVTCLDSTLADSVCTDGTAPAGVRVKVTGYTIFLGSTVPFLVGATSSYTLTLAPATTMPYMPL